MPAYKLLYNHDGWCVFSQSSPYQKNSEPVGLSQVHGYVDEAAEAGADTLLLSPVISKIPLWHSDIFPHWKETAGSPPVPESRKVDTIYNRVKAFVEAGHDIVRLSADRARQRNMDFFISWRMNECHDVRRDDSPIQSRFWREYPEYWIGGPTAKTLWGRALDFSHQAVQDYQFGLIRELCTRYRPEGLELDFLRFGKFFRSTLPQAEQFRIMGSFVEKVRCMLDEEAGGIPLCVRVPSRLDLVERMGLDLHACINQGLVQMINIAPFIVTLPDADIESFREAFLDIPLYGEITHCTRYGNLVDTCVFDERPITREELLGTAHSFLVRGCTGISTFNFPHTREASFNRQLLNSHSEPDFQGLRLIYNKAHQRSASKRYVLTDDRFSCQLPVRLNVEDEKTFRIHVADDLNDSQVHSSIKSSLLRVQTDQSSPPSELEAVVNERSLEPVNSNQVPDHHTDFIVPIALLKQGWNTFTVRLVSTPMVTIDRVELAINRDNKRNRQGVQHE